MGTTKNKMTFAQVVQEYNTTKKWVRGLKPNDVYQPDGKPINAYAIRRYLAAMQVLFDEIELLTARNDQLKKSSKATSAGRPLRNSWTGCEKERHEDPPPDHRDRD